VSDAPLSRHLSFAGGLVAFAWVAIAMLGPLAVFLTWYGDCFEEACPAPTNTDLWVYALDGVAWIAVGVIGLFAVARPNRLSFLVLAALGVAFAAQGIAAFLGARGFYGFPIILPAALVLIGGGIAGARALSPVPPQWAEQSTTRAVGLGCATYLVAYLGFPAIALIARGEPVGVLLVALVVSAVAIVVTLYRRLSSGRV